MVTVLQIRTFSLCIITGICRWDFVEEVGAYSNNIKLLILCYYLHYIFITLLIVEKNPIVFHEAKKKKKGKINFSNLLRGDDVLVCDGERGEKCVANNRMNNYLSTILDGISEWFSEIRKI